MVTKRHFFPFVSLSIKDGSEIRFGEGKWLGNTTLQIKYPALYNIVHHNGDTLANLMESNPPTLSLRRDLVGHRLNAWNGLLHRLAFVQLSQGVDEFR
jgi:hypothetical protein